MSNLAYETIERGGFIFRVYEIPDDGMGRMVGVAIGDPGKAGYFSHSHDYQKENPIDREDKIEWCIGLLLKDLAYREI